MSSRKSGNHNSVLYCCIEMKAIHTIKYRNTPFLLVTVIFLISCSSPSYVPRKVGDNIVLEDEEEEYELIILDNGFHSWFVSNAKPVGFYSLNYYEMRNQRYVSSWNELYSRYGGRGPFENRIDYDYSKDYGLKLNYQLFWYFKYIESLYGNIYPFPR